MSDFDIDAFDDTVSEGASASGGESTLDDGEEVTELYRDAPNVNFRPTTVIDAECIETFDFQGRIDYEENIHKSGDEAGDQFTVGLREPSVQYGEVWMATNGHSADYKVLNTEADDVEIDKQDISNLPVDEEDVEEDDLISGVTIGSNKFESERVEDLPERVTLWQGGRAGEFLARFLDVIGGGSAWYDPESGEGANALFEYPEDDRNVRVARTPTLREELVNQPIRLYYKFGDSNAHQVHVQTIPEVGAPEDAGEPLEPVYADDEGAGEPQYNSNIQFDENLGSANTDSAMDDDGDEDTDAGTHEDNPFADADASGADGSEYDPSDYTDLKEADKAYVDEMVSMWEDSPVSDVADIREAIAFGEKYETHVTEDDGPTGEVDADVMAEIINDVAA